MLYAIAWQLLQWLFVDSLLRNEEFRAGLHRALGELGQAMAIGMLALLGLALGAVLLLGWLVLGICSLRRVPVSGRH